MSLRWRQVIRCLLAGMPPGLHIPIHHDTGWWSMNSRRIHVPVHTDPERVVFRVRGLWKRAPCPVP